MGDLERTLFAIAGMEMCAAVSRLPFLYKHTALFMKVLAVLSGVSALARCTINIVR